jgi:hypothetical protein
MMPTETTDKPRTQPASFTERLGVVLKAWWKQPNQVATVIPSSSHLVEAVTRRDSIRHGKVIVKTEAFIHTLSELGDERLIVVPGDVLFPRI